MSYFTLVRNISSILTIINCQPKQFIATKRSILDYPGDHSRGKYQATASIWSHEFNSWLGRQTRKARYSPSEKKVPAPNARLYQRPRWAHARDYDEFSFSGWLLIPAVLFLPRCPGNCRASVVRQPVKKFINCCCLLRHWHDETRLGNQWSALKVSASHGLALTRPVMGKSSEQLQPAESLLAVWVKKNDKRHGHCLQPGIGATAQCMRRRGPFVKKECSRVFAAKAVCCSSLLADKGYHWIEGTAWKGESGLFNVYHGGKYDRKTGLLQDLGQIFLKFANLKFKAIPLLWINP